jgi:hypothetical protein
MSPHTHPPLSAERSTGRESAAASAAGPSGLLWLTWRQHRWAILGSLVTAAVLAGWMAYLAADMTALHHQCHDVPCPPYSPQQAALSARYGPVNVAGYLLVVVRYAPVLIGVFIGVPVLAREHEQRTLLLAWSQDVSPVRWLWTKLALLGLVVVALTATVAAVSDHLIHVLSTVGGGSLFADWEFMGSGMLPLAAGVCFFAVGVAFGAAIRRTLPAVFGVLAGLVGLNLLAQWRYPTLMTPLSVYPHFDQSDTGVLRNALIVKGGIRYGPGQPTNLFDSAGRELDYTALHRICPDPGTDPGAMLSCFAHNHLRTFTEYQPSSRIPVFHLLLAAGYLGLAAAALVAVWLIVRRTSLSAG